MNSTSTHFVPSRRMGIYEPIHQMAMWGDFKENNCEDTSPPMILDIEGKLDNQSEETSHGTVGPSSKYDQEASRRPDKSRNSTHKRQRQYFEQRKRQQRAAGSEGYVDGKPSCSQTCENNSSIEILSLVNVSSRAHEHETSSLRYFRLCFYMQDFQRFSFFDVDEDH